MSIAAAAAVAGTTAAAMYLDAKHHIRKDIRIIRTIKLVENMYIEAGMSLWITLGLHELLILFKQKRNACPCTTSSRTPRGSILTVNVSGLVKAVTHGLKPTIGLISMPSGL